MGEIVKLFIGVMLMALSAVSAVIGFVIHRDIVSAVSKRVPEGYLFNIRGSVGPLSVLLSEYAQQYPDGRLVRMFWIAAALAIGSAAASVVVVLCVLG
jgi:hypothetical protein